MTIKKPIITEQTLQMPTSQSISNILPHLDHVLPSRTDEIAV